MNHTGALEVIACPFSYGFYDACRDHDFENELVYDLYDDHHVHDFQTFQRALKVLLFLKFFMLL
jgi:hypothetical protein